MPIDKREWDKFFKMFERFNNGKLLKGYTYTSFKKTLQKGKDVYNKSTFSDNGFLQAMYRKNYLKSGFNKAGAYGLVKRDKYVNGNSKLIGAVFNKRKFKGNKSGFIYKGGYKYADKFIYKRFNSPLDTVNNAMKKDFNVGLEKAVNDAMKKGGFGK